MSSKLTSVDVDALRKKEAAAKAQSSATQNPYSRGGFRGANQNRAAARSNKELEAVQKQIADADKVNEERRVIEAIISERPDRKATTDNAEFQKMREMAFGGGPNPYYEAQRARAGIDQGFAIDDLSASSLGQMQNAYSQLAQSGGLSGGARERVAADSMVGAMKGRQGLRAQGMKNLADIGIAEEGTRATQQAGVTDSVMKETGFQNAYNTDVFNQNNEFRMAQRKSEQEREIAAQNKTKPPRCCFIFMEARYGNGTMDEVVRRYRDEHMTSKNQRGYYKLSEVLVPMMRKSRFVKFLTRVLMTDPLVAYAKAHYNEGSKLGFVFKPVKNFWLRAFDYLGGDHKFIRENGETV